MLKRSAWLHRLMQQMKCNFPFLVLVEEDYLMRIAIGGVQCRDGVRCSTARNMLFAEVLPNHVLAAIMAVILTKSGLMLA